MQPRQRIKRFVLENFLFTSDESALGDGDSLVRGGILDSTGIYELILHLEETFGVSIAPEEMVPDNFDTIEAIDRFVAAKLGS